MSEQSFPASDPPSNTPPPGTRRAERREAEEAAGEAKPKGLPTDDRYQQETAAARHEGVHPPERAHGDKKG